MSFEDSFVLPDGRVGYWKMAHPQGADRRDENGHMVGGRDTRAWVEDLSGRTTKASHGHARKFYCVSCVRELGGPEAPRRYF